MAQANRPSSSNRSFLIYTLCYDVFNDNDPMRSRREAQQGLCPIPELLGLAQHDRRLESPGSPVGIVHVKAEMSSEWLDLQKSAAVPALKKARRENRGPSINLAFLRSVHLPADPANEWLCRVRPAEKHAQALGPVADEARRETGPVCRQDFELS